jgi:hypothetical protein
MTVEAAPFTGSSWLLHYVCDGGGRAKTVGAGRPEVDTWIAVAQASDIAQLQGFAAGLLKDYDAVRNGLTLTWSNGAVEGTVTKLKAIKRARCGPPLHTDRSGFRLRARPSAGPGPPRAHRAARRRRPSGSAAAWGQAHLAAGGDPEQVAAAVEATTTFYVPDLGSR